MKKTAPGVLAQAEDPADTIEVTVVLCAYSEHSTHGELCEFVKFLRPAKVTPTVFGSEGSREKIVRAFAGYCDRREAKKEAFANLFGGGQAPKKAKAKTPPKEEPAAKEGPPAAGELAGMGFERGAAAAALARATGDGGAATQLPPAPPPPPAAPAPTPAPLPAPKSTPPPPPPGTDLETLVSMGFDRGVAERALKRSRGDVNRAAEYCMEPAPPKEEGGGDKKKKKTGIADFFSKK
jgi:hypothetical protein